MPIQWTDDVLNAQAAGTFVPPDTVKVHTDDPGAAGTDNLIASSDEALAWEVAGDEGPLGASQQPATPGRSYAAPSITLSDDGEWLSFWDGATFMGRVQCPQTATTGTYQPNLALVA
jgi:hypothetical protein